LGIVRKSRARQKALILEFGWFQCPPFPPKLEFGAMRT
jgi:hypothetical protein